MTPRPLSGGAFLFGRFGAAPTRRRSLAIANLSRSPGWALSGPTTLASRNDAESIAVTLTAFPMRTRSR